MKRISIEVQEELGKLYNIIVEGKLGDEKIQERVNIIRYLEEATGQGFKDTKDFKEKMERFFIGADKSIGAKLKEARKKQGLSQIALATLSGCSVSYLKKMESNKRPLNRSAIEFLRKSNTLAFRT